MGDGKMVFMRATFNIKEIEEWGRKTMGNGYRNIKIKAMNRRYLPKNSLDTTLKVRIILLQHYQI